MSFRPTGEILTVQLVKAELSSLSAFMPFRVQKKLMCREANALLKGGLNRTLGAPFGYKVKFPAKTARIQEKGFTLLELLVALA
ncbi:MAG: prepilin-type N-terminal cleavage/methylation domain-containing protein, partial [Desulfurivibrionaceae bacterium]